MNNPNMGFIIAPLKDAKEFLFFQNLKYELAKWKKREYDKISVKGRDIMLFKHSNHF